MLRICTCLLFVFASLAVAQVSAREVNKLSPNDSCSNTTPARKDDPTRSNNREVAQPAARDGKTPKQPSMHSDSDNSNRLQSPRWHNFLPGMFR